MATLLIAEMHVSGNHSLCVLALLYSYLYGCLGNVLLLNNCNVRAALEGFLLAVFIGFRADLSQAFSVAVFNAMQLASTLRSAIDYSPHRE